MAINPPPLTPKTKSKFNSLIIMLAVAMCFGLFAAIGIWQYLSQTQQKVKELSLTRTVVVAAKTIPAGTKLSNDLLTTKELPAKAIPKDYPSAIESVKGRIVKSTIKPEEIITETSLVEQGAAGGLPLIIPQGQRAITIRVNPVVGVGGFINPGDRVDVVGIFKKSDEQSFSRTVLQDVLILAVGDKILDPNTVAEAGPKVVEQVTVALSPQSAEKLALAHEIGQIHLVLRPHGEQTLASTAGATLEDVFGYFAYPTTGESTAPIPAGALQNKNSIEIILGSEKSYFYY